MFDLMDKVLNKTIKCLDYGFVTLVDFMPRVMADETQTADAAIVQAARVSYGSGTKTVNEDRGLIRYLMRHSHTTPIEMVDFKLHCKMPIFIARQWLRHRTACLSGDSVLYFDEPAALSKKKRKRSNMPISEFYDKWHNGAKGIVTRWGNEVRIPLKDRLSKKNLRSCNENNGEIIHTNITDIWQTGEKDVFEVELENGYKLKMTKDHLCLTDKGWLTLEQATLLKLNTENNRVVWRNESQFAVNGIPCYQDKDWLSSKKNEGLSVTEIANEANISYHSIRKYLKKFDLKFTTKEIGRLSGKAQTGTKRGKIIRKPLSAQSLANIRTARSGKNCNFWKGGISTDRENIGRWTTQNAKKIFERDGFRCKLCGNKGKFNAHHADPVWNNIDRAYDLTNLDTLCEDCHKPIHAYNLEIKFLEYKNENKLHLFLEDFKEVKLKRDSKKKLPNIPKLIRRFSKVKSIIYAGKEMTYDLSVEGPFHNFVCNGFIVHNSVNEISARYSVVKDEFYVPVKDNVRVQSKTNKQGGNQAAEEMVAQDFIEYIDSLCDETYTDYTKYIDDGISREQARMILPVNLYTEFYWKLNLHNLLHFLALRCDPHAQQEIQVYGNAILELIKPIVPFTIEAWEDYHPMRGAVKLTRLEVEAIKKYIDAIKAHPAHYQSFPEVNSDNKREKSEWAEKAKKLSINELPQVIQIVPLVSDRQYEPIPILDKKDV